MTAERLLNIIFEDDRLLVVDKPADLVCHPTKNGPLSSLIGRLRGEHGEIDAPIALARDHQPVTHHSSLITPQVAIRRAVVPDGQSARTEWWVEDRAPKFTLLRLRLHTGRAHQIRVHLAHIGHPIVGDKIYRGDERLYLQFIKTGITPALLEKLLLPRHALHAERLVVPHVAASLRDAKSSSSASRSDAATEAGDPVEWRAPLPEDMSDFWQQATGAVGQEDFRARKFP